jgi:hypothetical protein
VSPVVPSARVTAAMVERWSGIDVRGRRGGTMGREYLPKDLPLELTGKLFGLFEQHFGVTLRRLKDPQTGAEYVDLSQVCEVLGLDVDEERAKLLADPAYPADSLVIVEPPPPPPPMDPADWQAHQIGICLPETCRWCRRGE